MHDSPDVLTRLIDRVDHLEDRVFRLEHPGESSAAVPVNIPHAETVSAVESFSQSGAMFPILGRAMLGMAGAYALRALAESGSFPKLAAVALAIAYASAWLIGAIRVPAGDWFRSATYAGTSALILAPMLWELTLRFGFLSPATAAGVLATFVLAAYGFAWKRDLSAIVWVAVLTTAVTSFALLIATHDVAPFLAVLLLMALLSEIAVDRDRWQGVRPVAAIAADLAVCALVFIYSTPDSSHADYSSLSNGTVLAPACILLLIYGANVALRTIVLQQTITVFEIGQAVAAFLLAADAVLHFASTGGVVAFAGLCLALSAAGYASLFLRFDALADRRNARVYATWSAALFLIGSFWCVSPLWLPPCLGAAAIAATSLGARLSRRTLAFHGQAYLIAAAFASGAMPFAAHALAGAFPSPPEGIVWMVLAAAVLCYAIGGQFRDERRTSRFFEVCSAALGVGALATLLVSAMIWITASLITPGAPHVAVIRTLAGCLLALGLAGFGPRWDRPELVWLAYATLALVTAKLLFEDLRHGRPEFIAASIFLFAITLILVPRLARKSSQKAHARAPQCGAEPVSAAAPHESPTH